MKFKFTTLLLGMLLLILSDVQAQAPAAASKNAQPANGDAAAAKNLAKIEARAKRMVRNAKELLENDEADRAVGMLEAVPKMFPEAPSRFNAFLELGRHQIDKRQYDVAMGSLRKAFESADLEVQAEALLLQGECQLARGDAGEAAMTLRRVTQDYPTSLFANDAFFSIGQIHFQAGRWARATEAFEMVGTAVPVDEIKTNAVVLAEAGQRVYVHVIDKDLAVLAALGELEKCEFVARSGDKEKGELTPFGAGDGDFMASVISVTEPTQPYDGKLTVQGADLIDVYYTDQNTESGAVRVKKVAKAKVVSTATLAFMDGAQKQTVKGVFCEQPAFIRLRDLDADKTPQPDTIKVKVVSQYKEKEQNADGTYAETAEIDAPWLERNKAEVILTETDARSGIFTGRLVTRLMNTDTNKPDVVIGPGEIGVLPEDKVVVSYEDVDHLRGVKPEMRTAEALALVGGSTEPQSIIANSSDAQIQAKKLLLEAQLLHKWGEIFKEVGLEKHALDKAEEGLLRVEELMSLASRFSLERSIVESSFEVKWNLELVQGRLNAAIGTCRSLVRLYPDTTLADRAFMQIGKARLGAKDDEESFRSAIQVFNGILTLPTSPLKAEAQFRIGEAIEAQIKASVRGSKRKPDFSRAMVAYQRCADAYPESSYAGDSFKKVIDYYISIRDYSRCSETLERVFQDYPDAPWLDVMLLKWGVVCHRMGNKDEAIAKFSRLVEEYPGGQAATQATQFLKRLTQ